MLSLTSGKVSPAIEKAELKNWAQSLKRRGLASFAAAFLESGSAFATIATQGIYMVGPMLEIWLPRSRLDAVAELFEDPQQTAQFAELLREAK